MAFVILGIAHEPEARLCRNPALANRRDGASRAPRQRQGLYGRASQKEANHGSFRGVAEEARGRVQEGENSKATQDVELHEMITKLQEEQLHGPAKR